MIFSADRRPETTGSQPGRCWARRGASWWTGQTPTAASGRKRQCAQSGQGAAELVLLGPALGEMQGETAGFASDAPGQGEEASPEGLGGGHWLAQPDARRPAGEVMSHHPISSTGQALHPQPGGVGGEAARGQVVEAHAVLEVADGIFDLGVAAMVGFKIKVSHSLSVMKA